MNLLGEINQFSPVTVLNKRARVSNNPHGALGSSQSDVHTTNVSQETDASAFVGSDCGQHDNFLLLTLVSIDSVNIELVPVAKTKNAFKVTSKTSTLLLVRSDYSDAARQLYNE
jgi:hypothetical protein